jgi:DNA-binding transcriptional ArsR family regulator
MRHYLKDIEQQNRNRIIALLSKYSLTFTELIQKSGLSRGTVNRHLKQLESEGLTFREYKNKKLLIKLKTSEKKVQEVIWKATLENMCLNVLLDSIEQVRTIIYDEKTPKKALKKIKEVIDSLPERMWIIVTDRFRETQIVEREISLE